VNTNLLRIYRNGLEVARIVIKSDFGVYTTGCDSSASAKFTLDTTKINEWFMIGISFITISPTTNGVITIGNWIGWTTIFTCATSFSSNNNFNLYLEKRNQFIRYMRIYDYAKTTDSFKTMVQNSGCSTDSYGGSCIEWDATIGQWYSNTDFNTYITDISNGIENANLYGKLEPTGYAINGTTGDWIDNRFIKTLHDDYFWREIWGDGLKLGYLEWDDGNMISGDGCSKYWIIESGYTCIGGNEITPDTWHKWGNGILTNTEQCDDGNLMNNDGWNNSCNIEAGYSCSGNPSVWTVMCGDGLVFGTEQWDDGSLMNGDGWNSIWNVENGYICSGNPSIWNTIWGDGIVTGIEEWDDGNLINGDGCSPLWTLDDGWTWTNSNPTTCIEIWGDSKYFSTSTLAWDDSNTVSGDGCSSDCMTIETGFTCSGDPSICKEICSDGLVVGIEEWDDNNLNNGDGWTSRCTLEIGWSWGGTNPSFCTEIWGDNRYFSTSSLAWDDGNTISGDGCSSDWLSIEKGYSCVGDPSLCKPICGDGLVLGTEEWDDGGLANDDGWSKVWNQESGWLWTTGEPSICGEIWGDNKFFTSSSLICDDGNIISGDGWSSDWMTIEVGFACSGGSI